MTESGDDNPKDWVPPLVLLEECGHVWAQFIDEVYAAFYRDFIQSKPTFRGSPVACRRDPIAQGKEAGFWHCTSEGRDEQNRTPDTRRCERIAWVRAVIEHEGDLRIDCWPTQRESDKRCVLWFKEEYVVILAERTRRRDGSKYWQLITAYCTEYEHTRRKLRKERDAALGKG